MQQLLVTASQTLDEMLTQFFKKIVENCLNSDTEHLFELKDCGLYFKTAFGRLTFGLLTVSDI